MTRTVPWLLALVCLFAVSAPAAKAPPPLSPNRYLFVVDTSSAMSALDANLRQTFFDLIHSGLNGQMQFNDTFGVWTFNIDVDASYRMQVWDPKRDLELASRATFFVKNHHYEKRCRLDVAVANIGKVIKAAKDVTVFILSDGQELLQGTPFDAEINGIYRKNYAELHKGKSPFVTTLVARDGEIVAWSVVRGGDPFTLPLPPLPFEAAQKPAEKVPENSNAVAAAHSSNVSRTPAPIIINRASVGLPPVAAAPPPAPVLVPAPQTNENVIAPTPTAELANGAQTTSALPVQSVATISPSATQTGDEKHETAMLDHPAVALSAVPQKTTGPAAPKPLPSAVPAQFSVAARERIPSPDQPIEAPSAIVATVVTPKPNFSPFAMLLLGAALFLAAIGLIVLIVRHSWPAAQPSAITRSIQKSKQA
ncbi:MAG TPA: hypothetical protein VGK40_13200 [Verrucomicrobiae bacterium]|jgi:hypothetical protein